MVRLSLSNDMQRCHSYYILSRTHQHDLVTDYVNFDHLAKTAFARLLYSPFFSSRILVLEASY